MGNDRFLVPGISFVIWKQFGGHSGRPCFIVVVLVLVLVLEKMPISNTRTSTRTRTKTGYDTFPANSQRPAASNPQLLPPIITSHQHFPRLNPIRRPDNPLFFHYLDHAGSAVIPNA